MWVDAIPSPIEPLYGLTLANGMRLEDEILQWFSFYFFASRWLCVDFRFASLLPWSQKRILLNSEHCYVEFCKGWADSYFATLRKVIGQRLLPRKDPDCAQLLNGFPLESELSDFNSEYLTSLQVSEGHWLHLWSQSHVIQEQWFLSVGWGLIFPSNLTYCVETVIEKEDHAIRALNAISN